METMAEGKFPDLDLDAKEKLWERAKRST